LALDELEDVADTKAVNGTDSAPRLSETTPALLVTLDTVPLTVKAIAAGVVALEPPVTVTP
jgi:hypothetical protein